MLLVSAPLASLSLAGQEHGRTIPLTDIVSSFAKARPAPSWHSLLRQRGWLYSFYMQSTEGMKEGQAMPDEELFEKGLKTRRQVLGAKYVDANLAGSDDFMMTFQRAVTELAWGYA